MIIPISEKRLLRLSRALATQTRKEIDTASIDLIEIKRVATKYGVSLFWIDLPLDNQGYYLKDELRIFLNQRINNRERIIFTFYHELMHHLIEHDGEILDLLADAFIASDYDTMERLCNAGAAEILMPSSEVVNLAKEHEFSITLIPTMTERYNASSIAVAIQMINCASHECYLVIAEERFSDSDENTLFITHTGKSSTARLSIKKYQSISKNHFMYRALNNDGVVLKGNDRIPYASGWTQHANCEVLNYRGKIITFFNLTAPLSGAQLPLFDL